ncbi:MAG: hypothetical protein NTY65_12985, partial [Planctomycetota bacterium]|nr:hypothetical protein [Planctomycetota bacterium]
LASQKERSSARTSETPQPLTARNSSNCRYQKSVLISTWLTALGGMPTPPFAWACAVRTHACPSKGGLGMPPNCGRIVATRRPLRKDIRKDID